MKAHARSALLCVASMEDGRKHRLSMIVVACACGGTCRRAQRRSLLDGSGPLSSLLEPAILFACKFAYVQHPGESADDTGAVRLTLAPPR